MLNERRYKYFSTELHKLNIIIQEIYYYNIRQTELEENTKIFSQTGHQATSQTCTAVLAL